MSNKKREWNPYGKDEKANVFNDPTPRNSLDDATPEEWHRASQPQHGPRWYDPEEVLAYADKIEPEDNAGNALDTQVGGGHYKEMAMQPVEFIMGNGLGFCEGNAIKYICRYKSKGGVQDLDKAIHYIQLLKESYNGNS